MEVQMDMFISKLRRRRSGESVTNPYRDARLGENLRLYLEAMLRQTGPRVLLVGEAPGYKGCGLTGIPFSCGTIYGSISHSILDELAGKITLDVVESENTAKIVWTYLAKQAVTPLFWNSFPFHPHPIGNTKKNRAPTRAEIDEGGSYLKELVTLYVPDVIAGIGRKGTSCAQLSFPDREIRYIRHPSYGGKSDFIRGMNEVLGEKQRVVN